MPNPSGVNRKKRPTKKKEPRFLRKAFPGYGRGAPVKVLRILGWTLAIWFASAILLGDSGLFSILRMKRMRNSLAEEITELEGDLENRRCFQDRLEDDPETIERVAREEYGMIRDGEISYIVTLEDENDENDEE